MKSKGLMTTYPLRMTTVQKEMLIRFAKMDGVDPDKPGELNDWILKQLGVDE